MASRGRRPADAAKGLVPLFLALLLAVPLSGAWTQFGGDAASTGAIDAGPAWNDIAFEVKLPGRVIGMSLLRDREAFFTTVEPNGFWRVDLDEGKFKKIPGAIESGQFGLLGDMILRRPGPVVLEAMNLTTGVPLWSMPGPATANPGTFTAYSIFGAAHDGRVIVIPYVTGPEVFAPSDILGRPANAGLIAVDAATGQIIWEGPDAAHRANLTGGLSPAVATGQGVTILYARVATGANSVAGSAQPVRTFRLLAFDAVTGALKWEREDQLDPFARVAGNTVAESDSGFNGGIPVITDNFVFVRTDRFTAINPSTGATIWESSAGLTDPNPVRGMLTAGWGHGALVASTAQTIYRLDPLTGEPVWQRTTPGRFYSVERIAISPTHAYIPYFLTKPNEPITRGVECVDLVTGRQVWSHEKQEPSGPGDSLSAIWVFGSGLAVRGGVDGTIIVIGRTGASMTPPPLKPEQFLPVGQDVTIDLSGGGAGAFGAPTRYRADWGDGNITEWQASPTLSHSYSTASPTLASFTVGNDANQTVTTTILFRVGETEPNLLSQAFAPENQDRTFFILGAAVSAGGALIGLLAVRRKRGRLQREIAAVDKLAHDLRDDASACDLAMRERRVRARGLLVDGKLTDAHVSLLEKHIDDVSRRVRLSEVDHQFDFLPQGIARRLREALADGRISTLEREHLTRLVDEDTLLTPEQKARVHTLVDDWWSGDARGNTPKRGLDA